jgi:hypothetical protein
MISSSVAGAEQAIDHPCANIERVVTRGTHARRECPPANILQGAHKVGMRAQVAKSNAGEELVKVIEAAVLGEDFV